MWGLQEPLEQMTAQLAHDVLRRMVASPPPAPEDVPITSSRAMRLALTRAADKAHGLIINVEGLREETLPLDEMLSVLEPELMLVGMYDNGDLLGLCALDLNFRAALLEVQTVGKILPVAPEARPATGTDARLSETFLITLLRHMAETTPRTPLDGWGQGLHPDGKVATTRAAGLILPERDYRVIRMSLDLQVADRQGELVMALPVINTAPPPPPPEVAADWSEQFQRTINAAPARLVARLHTFKLPLHVAETLKVGQVLPLQGCTVSSVRLVAPDGTNVATARLGQSGGMRAVRVEKGPSPPQMEEMEGLGGANAGLPPVDMSAASAGDDMAFDMATSQPAAIPDSDVMAMDGDFATGADTLSDAEDVAPQSDPTAAQTAPPKELSWDDEDLDAPMATGAAAPLDWSDENL